MVLKTKTVKESKRGLILDFYQLNRQFLWFLPNPIRVWYPIEPAGPIWFLKLWEEGYYSIKYMTNKNPKNTIPHLSSHSSYPYNLIGHIIFNQNSQLLVDR